MGEYDIVAKSLEVFRVQVVQPALSQKKRVRQNSLDLESAKQLCQGAHEAMQGADVVFAEVPVGSQSARAMASYGICVGILGSLRALSTPFFEVTPSEVKMVSVGRITATKQEMIDWAVAKHPEANWPVVNKKGGTPINASKAEHMADALGSVYAGIGLDEFQQMIAMQKTRILNGNLESCS